MILILGGTTEGRTAARTLEEAGNSYYYSTKGDEQEIALHHGVRLQGGMDADAMENFCLRNGIRLIIDAAHPFAVLLHETVNKVADRLRISVIRYERIYPSCPNPHIHWCSDFDDAVSQIQEQGISRLLALTGVQTISRLKPLWEEGKECYFRILNRESSRKIAEQAGFPTHRLCYYVPDGDERIILRKLRPEAILMKESGISGGFVEKANAALEENIAVYAIKRPALPKGFITVNGEHGLRRMVEKLLPEFYPLRSGVSTGTCATAASVAAIWNLQAEKRSVPKEFPVILPNGETIYVAAEPSVCPPCIICEEGKLFVESEATVCKDAGDDPDITNGMEIKVKVAIPYCKDNDETSSLLSDAGKQTNDASGTPIEPVVIIRGGEGVGIVTIPGLGLEIGGPAINTAPRRMIEENVRATLYRLPLPSVSSPVIVTVSAVGGAEVAQRTFNPRLGIEGGISIIGTSGIVKPFSSAAFINSIRKSMEVARATGSNRVVINSGAKSEKFVRMSHPDVPAQAFVHYGNFIGETLKIAAELNIPSVTLGIMIGKAVKLAEGYLDTHSKQVTMNKEFLQEIAQNAGCEETTCKAIGGIKLARELWTLLPEHELSLYCKELLRLCHTHCNPLLPNGELEILLITEEGQIIA